MVGFFDEYSMNELQQRDKMQFELRSTHCPVDETEKITYSHEFYFFIPQALQINEETYPKNQFYLDQTNLIRFKTPTVPLTDIGDLRSSLSPLGRIYQQLGAQEPLLQKTVKFELKLFGNTVRSQIRDRTQEIVKALEAAEKKEEKKALEEQITQLCKEIRTLHMQFSSFQSAFFKVMQNKLLHKFCDYVDEFVCTISEHFLLILLRAVRTKSRVFSFEDADRELCTQVLSSQEYRKKKGFHSPFENVEEKKKEFSLYRAGVLNKFVLEALLLSTQRKEPAKQFDQLIAVMAAGIAMFLYLALLVLYGRVFIVDATAFISVSVLLYIVKDRLKEGLKSIYYGLAFRWFPDYTTKIKTLDQAATIGDLRESFTFLSRNQVPKEIVDIRDRSFHIELEMARRLENIFYFKKEVVLFPGYSMGRTGLKDLHDIFRFNISQFTLKASDVYQDFLKLNPRTYQLEMEKCPKVYHINVIIKKTQKRNNVKSKETLSKVRIVLNKEGIERVETVD